MKRFLALSFVLWPSLASAHDFFSEADLGAAIFLGEARHSVQPGPAFGARVGWGPAHWLHFGVLAAGSTHEATVPPPPAGELFQIYQGGLTVRVQGRIGRVGLFVEGAGGLSWITTNVLDQVGLTSADRHWGAFFQGGGGFQYHTQNPRFGLGLAGDYVMYPSFDSMQALSVRVYLRYTR
jgi:hypothetical protein